MVQIDGRKIFRRSQARRKAGALARSVTVSPSGAICHDLNTLR
jgi:hypothetical protein